MVVSVLTPTAWELVTKVGEDSMNGRNGSVYLGGVGVGAGVLGRRGVVVVGAAQQVVPDPAAVLTAPPPPVRLERLQDVLQAEQCRVNTKPSTRRLHSLYRLLASSPTQHGVGRESQKRRREGRAN